MSWKSNLVSLLAGTAVVATGAWIAWSPWRTVAELHDAAARSDRQALATLVDQPGLSATLVARFGAELDDAMRADPPTGARVADVRGTYVNRAVEALLRPEGLRLLLEGTLPTPENLAQTGGRPAAATEAYIDFDHFGVQLPLAAGGIADLTLTRTGSSSWQLTDLRLPPQSVVTAAGLRAAIAQADAAAGAPVGMASFDGDCVDRQVAEFRAAHPDGAEAPAEMFNAWLQACRPAGESTVDAGSAFTAPAANTSGN